MQSRAGPMNGLEAELLSSLKCVHRDEAVKGGRGSWVQRDLRYHAKEVALLLEGRRILVSLTWMSGGSTVFIPLSLQARRSLGGLRESESNNAMEEATSRAPGLRDRAAWVWMSRRRPLERHGRVAADGRCGKARG